MAASICSPEDLDARYDVNCPRTGGRERLEKPSPRARSHRRRNRRRLCSAETGTGRRFFDRGLHAAQAQFTGGCPWRAGHGLGGLVHPSRRPAGAAGRALRQARAMSPHSPPVDRPADDETLSPSPNDRRFTDAGWQHGYFALARKIFARRTVLAQATSHSRAFETA